jgi:hypothetical protein
MTVEELIILLQELPKDLEVVMDLGSNKDNVTLYPVNEVGVLTLEMEREEDFAMLSYGSQNDYLLN